MPDNTSVNAPADASANKLGVYSTLNQIVNDAVNDYLTAVQGVQPRPAPELIERDLVNLIGTAIEDHNTIRSKCNRMKIPQVLPPAVIAHVVKALYPVYRIPCAGRESDPAYDVLGLYQEDGPDKGIYATSELVFRCLLRRFNLNATARDYSEFMSALAEIAERHEPCQDRDFIAVNNGIFDYKTKQLLPFSPDYVFLSKSRVNYVSSAGSPVIHNSDDGTDWDVDSWIHELSDDPEIVNLIWEILGAVIRPNVSWNKAAFFHSETGNNGKGTLCALMRNLCGPGTCCSISLADFGNEFMLEPLMRASAIIVDENSVGAYADKSNNFKAAVTGDVLFINRKYEKPISIRFRGFMVQCVNELPRVKDKSDSLYRRLLFVPFSKCFTGRERKYIKDDYLSRPDVLEYVLHKVLNMTYYELSNPAACQDLIDEYKQANDPLREFADEIFPQLVWDMVPLAFLYDLYKAWFTRYHAGGIPLSKPTFNRNIFNLQADISGWMCPGIRAAKRPGQDMSKPEPLIREYNLIGWTNPACPDTKSPNWTIPPLKSNYKGYFSRVLMVAAKTA